MDQWTGYFVIQRIVANLNEANWSILIDEINQLQGVNEFNQPYEKTHRRGNEDRFSIGTGEILAWYSNIYIYSATFPANAVDFEKFKNRLADLFEVNPNAVSYTTQQITYRNRPSVVATYKYGANNRIRVALLGCASDSELCMRDASNEEVLQVLDDDKAGWGETGT